MRMEKIYKEIQNFDKDLMYFENDEILRCFDHFRKRFKERYRDHNITLSYKEYWDIWIVYLRGHPISSNKMIRSIGNYMKDPIMYKVIYTKIKVRNSTIFVPLTIYGIEDHKRKFRMFKMVLKNKKL